MIQILQGDALTELRKLDAESVQCCVTSPPYWGLRDYGVAGQLGLESTPDLYVQKMVEVFRDVKRVLRDDGTLWLNLGDSYAGSGKARGGGGNGPSSAKQVTNGGAYFQSDVPINVPGCKPKDLVGIPWLVAFALRADGWYLRSDIIWHKPNPMPESVTDRPTKAHEYIFLMSKSANYFYDADVIKEPGISAPILPWDERKERGDPIRSGLNGNPPALNGKRKSDKQRGHSRRHAGFNDRWDQMEHDEQCSGMRNKRSVWTVSPAQFAEAHFATFPPDLIKPCILAGCPAGGTVLDPFGGSGTTGMVALELGRKAVLIELNPEYCKLIESRTNVTPGLQLV